MSTSKNNTQKFQSHYVIKESEDTAGVFKATLWKKDGWDIVVNVHDDQDMIHVPYMTSFEVPKHFQITLKETDSVFVHNAKIKNQTKKINNYLAEIFKGLLLNKEYLTPYKEAYQSPFLNWEGTKTLSRSREYLTTLTLAMKSVKHLVPDAPKEFTVRSLGFMNSLFNKVKTEKSVMTNKTEFTYQLNKDFLSFSKGLEINCYYNNRFNPKVGDFESYMRMALWLLDTYTESIESHKNIVFNNEEHEEWTYVLFNEVFSILNAEIESRVWIRGSMSMEEQKKKKKTVILNKGLQIISTASELAYSNPELNRLFSTKYQFERRQTLSTRLTRAWRKYCDNYVPVLSKTYVEHMKSKSKEEADQVAS